MVIHEFRGSFRTPMPANKCRFDNRSRVFRRGLSFVRTRNLNSEYLPRFVGVRKNCADGSKKFQAEKFRLQPCRAGKILYNKPSFVRKLQCHCPRLKTALSYRSSRASNRLFAGAAENAQYSLLFSLLSGNSKDQAPAYRATLASSNTAAAVSFGASCGTSWPITGMSRYW